MPTVIQALSAVMADVRAVAKTDQNQQQGFSFRGIDAVVNAVGPKLRDHGVVVLPVIERADRTTVEVGSANNRRSIPSVTVTVTYRFYGPDGDHVECRTAGEAMDMGDKATAKAMSVAFRTALLQALALPTHEPDPDHDTYEVAEVKPSDPDRLEAARAAIAEATNVEELKDAGAGISAGVKAGAINQADADALRNAWSARKAEIEAAA